MAKIKEILPDMPQHHQFLYWCEGCGYEHAFALKSEGGHHSFNGDLNNPTVSPSLVDNFSAGRMCHSFINEGKIKYLGDCTHHLAIKTVELLDCDEMMASRTAKINN
jgi:hypothetical protein